MANKVNIKFVLALGATLVALFAVVAWIAFEKLTTSGKEYEAQGDALFAQGDFDDAANNYRLAVAHDRTNVEWLTKWREALLKVVPDTKVEYVKYYSAYYRGILGTLAALQEDDPDVQRAYFDTLFNELRLSNASPESWLQLVDQITPVLDRLPDDDPRTQSLHRYRAFAELARSFAVELRDDEITQTRQDLDAALAGDPSDVEAAEADIRWYAGAWRRAFRARREQTTNAAWQAVEDEIAIQKKQFNNNPIILLTELQLRTEKALQSLQTPKERMDALKGLQGSEAPLLEAMEGVDPTTLDPGMLDRAYTTVRTIRAKAGVDAMLPIIERALAAQPQDAQLMLLHARALKEDGRPKEAIQQFAEIINMPDLPVSLDGLMLIQSYRSSAIYLAADATFLLLDQETDPAAKKALIEQATAYRDQLIEQVDGGADAPTVMLLDGRLAIAENRPRDAVERLSALDKQLGGRDAQVVRYLGYALTQSNLLGAARQQYQRLVDANPADVDSLLRLGDVERRLQEYDWAASRYEKALTLVPDLTEARVRLETVRAEQGDVRAGVDEATDPVTAALIRWRTLMRQDPPEPDEALATLKAAHQKLGDDPRILNAMIFHYNQAGARSEAMALAEKAIKLYPDDARFPRWRQRLQITDADSSIETKIAAIEADGADKLTTLLTKATLYLTAQDAEKGDQALAEAQKLAPEDPRVIESLFSRALAKKDFDQARTLAATAARLNLDSVDGLLYQARIEFAQDDLQKAQSSLEQAADRLPYDPFVWRLLGQTRIQLGLIGDALDALAKASRAKPDDLITARLYGQTLARLQRYKEALTVVHDARRFHPDDPSLNGLWLTLEEQVGDRSLALDHRRKRFAKDPKDLANATALARMLTADKQWDEARTVLDVLRQARPEDGAIARMDADWHAKQGDIESGADLLRARTDPDHPVDPLLLVAQYYLDNGDKEKAAGALADAQRLEGPGEKKVELIIADLHFRDGEYEKSLPLFREALAAGVPGREGDVGRRLADALLRLKRYDDTQKTLDALPAAERDDPRSLILRSRAMVGAGDERGAAILLDNAIKTHPTSAALFIERAMLSSKSPDQRDDALADTAQAIRIAPTMVEAHRLRASLLVQANRLNEAVSEIKSAIETIPNDRTLRRIQIELLVRMKQNDRAIEAADAAADAFPRDSSWLLTAGDLNARADRWDEALKRYQRAYDISPVARIAVRVGQALLTVSPARPHDALTLMDAHMSDESYRSTVRLLKAQALSTLGDADGARALADQSFDEARTPADLRDWFTGIATLYPVRADMIAYVQTHTPPAELGALYTVLLAQLEATDPARTDSVIATLRAVDTESADPLTRADLDRLLGQLLYATDAFDEAAKVYRSAVELAPNDLEFNNNLAYILARHLDDAAGALAPAERAAQISPSDSNVLDTLGWVYSQLGRLDEAAATLNRAIDNASDASERAPAYLHMAQTLLQQDDPSRARRYAENASALIKKNQSLLQEYGPALTKVMRQLDSTE